MSDQPKDKKDEEQENKALWELTEEPWPEELWPEETQAEKPRTEEPQTDGSRTDEAQAEEPLTDKPQAEEPLTEKQPKHSEEKNDPPPSQNAAGQKKQKWIMIALIAMAVISVVAMVLVLLHNRWFKRPDLPPLPSQTVSGNRPSAGGSSPSSAPGPVATQEIITVQPLAGGERRSEDFYTILIFGMDKVSGLTDSIMVASYDVTNQKATVLSIPRDTLVNNRYLDKGNKSINATYKQNGKGEQGAAALKTEISRLLGFVPDYYVTIDWELVGKMVDAIDGVEFEVPWRMKYDDPYQDLHIDLMPGLQTLDGEHAMQLVRWRKNNTGVSSSDISRLNVQHDFLKAVLKQTLKPQNIMRIPELINLFNENVVSDLAVENMLWFGQQAVLGGLSADDVEFLTVPVYGTTNKSGRYYGKVCPNINQLLKIINNSMNPYVENVTLQQLDLIQMSTDGNTLSSTTGTLRNPSSGVYNDPNAPTATDPPESDPGTTDPPESDPGTTDPAESDPGSTDPAESDPGTTDPAESDPGTADPAESGSGTTDPTENNPNQTQTDGPPPETGPAGTDGDGPDNGDWGYTPD